MFAILGRIAARLGLRTASVTRYTAPSTPRGQGEDAGERYQSFAPWNRARSHPVPTDVDGQLMDVRMFADEQKGISAACAAQSANEALARHTSVQQDVIVSPSAVAVEHDKAPRPHGPCRTQHGRTAPLALFPAPYYAPRIPPLPGPRVQSQWSASL